MALPHLELGGRGSSPPKLGVSDLCRSELSPRTVRTWVSHSSPFKHHLGDEAGGVGCGGWESPWKGPLRLSDPETARCRNRPREGMALIKVSEAEAPSRFVCVQVQGFYDLPSPEMSALSGLNWWIDSLREACSVPGTQVIRARPCPWRVPAGESVLGGTYWGGEVDPGLGRGQEGSEETLVLL